MKRLVWSGLGFGEAETSGSAVFGDDSEAIVLEVSDAIAASLDTLHLSVEALGEAVGFGKSPHGGDLGQLAACRTFPPLKTNLRG